jgi:tRNA U34 2-thiouridine synthase MnmA/TrmU
MSKKVRALGLLSGGLDSILAVKVLEAQGIEVTGLSFVTPFFGPALAEKAANDLEIELIIKDISDIHFRIVKNPPHGYGKTMNPCIDCHALMLNIAGQLMEAQGFDFIFTGEVLDERPMSQNKRSLDVVADESGYADYVLRPLSAKLLDITLPEKQGKVDRDKLLDIRGRSRKPQIQLAEQFKVKEYPNPAGGCLLTDKGFSTRLSELLSKNKDPDKRELQLLSVGRHFRLSDNAKLVLGRDQKENEKIRGFFQGHDYMLTALDIPGPWCLLLGADDQDRSVLIKASRICAAYSDTESGQQCTVELTHEGAKQQMQVTVDKKDKTELRIN